LAVLSIALGVAFGAASLFGVSFALGAFFAGMILAESELSQRAAEETLPLRDAFAVLFFVSVGMLFDWRVVLREPLPLLATLGVVVVGKSVAALILMRVLRRSGETSFTVAASLAQIGEFSFILAGLGVELGLLPREGRDLILGGAIFSILLNPLAFGLAARLVSTKGRGAPAETVDLSGHTVVVGYGRVGQRVAEGLRRAKMDFVVVEAGEDAAALARERGLTVIEGNAADPRILAGANLPKAGRLVVAIPDAFEAGQVAEQARQANRGVQIIARAHSDAEVAHLLSHGAGAAIMGEREIADRMVETVTEQGGEARAEPPPLGRTPPGLILDDVERIVLSGFQVGEANAYQTLAADALEAHAEAHGVSRARAQAAIGGLEAKGCLAAVGDDHVSLTETGFLAVSTTRKPL
jgi:CPA2 family monovalent cation:H+ antiporter-2